jgi:hypothetical protein
MNSHEIANAIHGIVHVNIPPVKDAGTLENLNTLIDELSDLRAALTNEESNKNQKQFEF